MVEALPHAAHAANARVLEAQSPNSANKGTRLWPRAWHPAWHRLLYILN